MYAVYGVISAGYLGLVLTVIAMNYYRLIAQVAG
jgi:hypothetical protein